MTTTPTRPASTAPVPWGQRRAFTEAMAIFRPHDWELAYGNPTDVLRAAAELARYIPWTTVDDVALEFAHLLGPGWGAAFRLWVHEHVACLCWEGWVSHSEVGRAPSPECLLHRGEVGSDV